MPTSVISYPVLSGIVRIEQLPEEFSFLNENLSELLDKIFYKSYQIHKSDDGVTSNYYIEILLFDEISFEIPGTGLEIGILPATIRITFSYSWSLLKYVSSFNVSSFDFSQESSFNLMSVTHNSDDTELLLFTVGRLIGGTDPFGGFISHLNTDYATDIPTNSADDFEVFINTVLAAIKEKDLTLKQIVIDDYLPEASPSDIEMANKIMIGTFDSPVEAVKDVIKPKIFSNVETSNLGVLIRIPRNVLLPMLMDGDDCIVDPNETAKLTLQLMGGNLSFSPGEGLKFNEEIAFVFAPPHVKGQIGNTGITMAFDKVFLDLSKSTNLAAAAGLPPYFKGAFIPYADISLPAFWNVDSGQEVHITGKNLLIGTGGISGVIGLENVDPDNSEIPPLSVHLGEFTIGLSAFNVKLLNNTIIDSNIWGMLFIKGFKDATGDDAQIKIQVHFDGNGDFSITASEDQGIQALHLPGVFSLNLDSLTVGKRDGRYYVAISGLLDLVAQSGSVIGDNLPSGIPIPKMIIWEDGGFEFEGGAIVLPKAFSLKLGPAAISVTAIHIGSHEQDYDGHYRKFKYFGFDGGISLNPGGVDARGDGIKFYYTVDMEESGLPYRWFLRIQSLVIDIVIPDTADPDKQRLVLHGYLAMKEPANDDDSTAQTDYSGGIAFKLNFEKLKIAGSADMRYNPALPSFLVDIGIELPVPIPIGTTGLGIYGFRGLIGSSYVASRSYIGLTEEDPWYMYYKEETPPIEKEGITASKFSPERGLSLGAGVSFATAAGDSGKFFSSN